MNLLRTLTIAVLGLALAGATVGCKKEEPAGPAEKLGAAMDGAVKDAAEAAEGAAEAGADAAKEAEKAAEEATK